VRCVPRPRLDRPCRGEACLALVSAKRVKHGDIQIGPLHYGSVHHRRSLRLDRWDYRELSVYFVTITTRARATLLGAVADGEVMLSPFGEIARQKWVHSAVLREGVELDLFVVMPNHVHGLVVLRPPPRLPDLPRDARFASRSLGALVGGFKAATSRRINDLRGTPGRPVWQRNYYDRIVRDEDELDAIRAYIGDNPSRWSQDPEHPLGPGHVPGTL
jgi:putative transposase